ncbi:MAG: hypothetical protein ACFFBP_14540 [Promethearchaeota archaeon]
MSTRSEDTLIFYALTPGHYQPDEMRIIYDSLKEFCDKKKNIDNSDRFNIVLFQEDGPNYLEDFTLNPENILIALESLEPMIVRANMSGGIMVSATFIIDVFKKIPNKCFRMIILTDNYTHEIPDIYIPVLDNILEKIKDMPLIVDILRINVNNYEEDLKLSELIKKTRGKLHEVQNLNELSLILDLLAEKKTFSTYSLSDDMYPDEIPIENHLFYKNLADDPILKIDKQTCSICFKKDNNAIVQCPNCETTSHKICWALWSKNSNIGIFNIFRCHTCFHLLKLDDDFVYMVHTGQLKAIEEIKVDVMDLHEFEESIEAEDGPKIIAVEDPMAMLFDKNDDDIRIIDDEN